MYHLGPPETRTALWTKPIHRTHGGHTGWLDRTLVGFVLRGTKRGLESGAFPKALHGSLFFAEKDAMATLNGQPFSTGPIAPTPAQIQKLQNDWLADRCWDIEDTDGFAAVRDELKAWRNAIEEEEAKRQRERDEQEITRINQTTGFSLPQACLGYLLQLERRIRKLEGHDA